MEKDQKVLGKEVFDLIMGKVTLLRIEMELLECEGNGIRLMADEIVKILKATPAFNDPANVDEASSLVHQKWAEQVQRHYTHANTVGKIMLEKSRQILDLVQILKTKLRELGFVVPEDDEFIVWDEMIFEKDEHIFEEDIM